MKVGKLAFILEGTKDHFALFLEMFNSILHDNILRLLIHSTDKTPVVDKRDITKD